MKKLSRSMKLLLSTFAVLALVIPASAQGQGAVITGRVISDQNQPLAGANIQIPELDISVGTNQAGVYTVTIPGPRVTGQAVTVRARAIGYRPASNPIALSAGTQTINFTLTRDVTELSAVVVTGVTKATEQIKLPFTVARLDSSAMPVTGTNAIAQIQGKIPGAMVVAASGRPGTAPSIVLRGPVSMNATGRGQGPLFLLDGVPLLGGLPDINPSDIETIEVVKGAGAAALYGARAGAGVINITTKSGRTAPEGIHFGARTEVGAGDLERAFPLARYSGMRTDPSGQFFCTREFVGGSPCARYIEWDREVQRINNSGEDYSLPPQQFLGEVGFSSAPTYDAMTGTFYNTPYPIMRDPVAQLSTPALFANSSVDMRAKVNNTGVYASIGNLTQQGTIQFMGGFVRNSARVNVDQRFTDKISGNINSFYSQVSDHGAQLDTEGAGSGSPFFTITRAPWIANLEARDNLGRLVIRHNPLANGSQNRNPLYGTTYNPREDKGTRFVGGASLRYSPLSWLNLDGNFGYDRSGGRWTQLRDRGYRTPSADPGTAVGYVYQGSFDEAQYSTSLSAAANKTFFGDLVTTFTTRYQYGDQTITFQDQYGEDIVVAGLKTATATTINKDISSSVQQIRDMGFFYGLDFDYKDRYILSGLLRRDGSSLFGAGNRWQTFGRVAAAWIVSREPWWFAPEALSVFKLRASQGTTGQRPRFTAQYETYTIGTGGTLNPNQLGNKNLKPEINKETELGADLEFFGRVGLNVSHALAVIDRQILPVDASAASGFSQVWINAGEVTNKTWEATLTLPIVNRGNFNWTSRLIWDQTRSEITRLDVPEFTGNITAANTFTVFKFREGEKIGTLYGVQFVRECSQLPGAVQGRPAISSSTTNFQAQCSMNPADLTAAYRPNDEGYIVWVGAGNQTSEGITRNLWRAQLPLGTGPWGNRVNWGMPFAMRDSDSATFGTVSNVPVGNGLPKYHWGLSQNINWGRLDIYGLLDAAMGHKLFNIQYAWSLGDGMSGAYDQVGKSVEEAKPVGYYWRQGGSASPTSGSTAGIGGFYDALGPNSYNMEDASYVKLRELAFSYRLGAIGGSGDWKVGLIGRNLKTWTDFRGFDPESGNTSGPLGSAALTGVAGYRYPKQRTYTVQLSTSF